MISYSLTTFNTTINVMYPWQYDPTDFWLTPMEFLSGRHPRDCEDFSIYKYFALKKQGHDVRLLMCINGKGQMHMVCLANGYVLDNESDFAVPLIHRKDLDVILMFNETHLWHNGKVYIGKTRIKKWQGVLDRMKSRGRRG